ncbi:MAG: right-handed parallel beta-helix repeat-containing protein [Solirubrobacterales bacterium]
MDRAAAIGCGASVKHDVVLHEDLSCSGSDGLVVTRDDVTVDLNGHEIRGDGSGRGIATAAGSTFSGHLRITSSKAGGTIREFNKGIELIGAAHSTVEKARLESNGTGIEIRPEDRNKDIVVRGVKVLGSSGTGLDAFLGSNLTVRESRFVGNESGISLGYFDESILKENVVLASGGAGVTVGVSDGVEIASNSIFGTGGIGIDATQVDGTGLTVTDNDVRHTHATGIALDAQEGPFSIRKNRVRDASGHGVEVTGVESGQVRLNNVAYSFGDGIRVLDTQAVVAQNAATENRGVGIRSQGIDGQGNYASGNGDEDCLGVECPAS